MDIKITYKWLKKFIDTNASAMDIAKYLTLSGPSIERVVKLENNDYLFNIEVTTNRVDSASVSGIAREAAAILPRYKFKAKLKNPYVNKNRYRYVKKVKYLDTIVDPKLCNRFSAVLIKNVNIKESPPEIQNFLKQAGLNPINNIVDISNLLMYEFGQPVHTFDYDRISDAVMTLRESKKGEKITTLDDKEFTLAGGDIVIEDGSERLIDLCGIMGGKNSSITDESKNVLLFVQNYDPLKIRKTSLYLNQRTQAAQLFEKSIDSENVKKVIENGIYLIELLSGGTSEKEILDLYPKPSKVKSLEFNKEDIDRVIGVSIPKGDIDKYLTSLGFEIKWKKDRAFITVPSWRGNDINIKEDIAEEVARIYGYHNLPSKMIIGEIPDKQINNQMYFEEEIKNILVSIGSYEVYNLSLTERGQIKIKNPLGSDTSYLRSSLKESLLSTLSQNKGKYENLNFFEMANIYIEDKDNLPLELLTLSGITDNYSYQENKGFIETLLDRLNIDYSFRLNEVNGFLPNQSMSVFSGNEEFGYFGNLDEGYFYYQFDVYKLYTAIKKLDKYEEPSKYPPQLEDLTVKVPEKTYVMDIISTIKEGHKYVSDVTLLDIYERNYTFQIKYHNPEKTLSDDEVNKIRNEIIKTLNTKLGVNI